MKAGFAKVCITPPIGTRMYGFASRDKQQGCQKIHDDLFVRALYLTHEQEQALIMGFDLLFFSRADVDRYKGAIGRKMDLAPRQILFNTSHTHCGPMVGTTWTYADYCPEFLDRFYADELEHAILRAAHQASATAREVTVWAGAGRSSVPLSRRRKDDKGNILFAPNPNGVVCDLLPVCLFRDMQGKPVCLMFSVSCHPSTIGGFEISADFPGPAMDLLDKHFGATCSLFLQGTGGDAKARIIGKGDRWVGGTWEDVAETGRILAQEVKQVLGGQNGKLPGRESAGLVQVEPQLRCALLDMDWPLAPPLDRKGYESIAVDPKAGEIKQLWAKRQVEKFARNQKLPSSVPVTLHGIKIGKGLRLVGLEGEAVAGLGLVMLDFYKDKGITFPLGYTDGAQLYLPTSAMLDEGGYEATSYHEYGWPAPLAKGIEDNLKRALQKMWEMGIDD